MAHADKPVPGLACAVLAGGASKRMGRDKAWLEFDGEPLLTRICRVVHGIGELFVAIGQADRRLPELPEGARLVTDVALGQGPMAGMLAVADALPDNIERVFFCGCDLPFLSPQLVRVLDRRWQAERSEIVVPEVGGRLQPLVAVYGRGALVRLRSAFAAGDRRLSDFVASREPVVVSETELSEFDLDAFDNLNRADDYERALRRLDQDARQERGGQ